MGWTGGGLGKSGEGIINPIEVQVRPERAGLAYGGLKEKTKQAKEEARRRGEAVSSSEEDERGGRRSRRKKKKDQQASASKDERQPLNPDLVQAWTKAERKPRKPRVQHRTYEQIIEQAGGSAATEVGLGQIIDATGKEMREVSSIASALAQHSVPTSDSTRLPELRHNLRLICDTNKQTLDALAREGAGIVERTKWLKREAEESRRRRDKERVDLARLKEVISIVTQLETLGRNAALSTSTSESNKVQEGELEVFDPLVKILVRDFQVEIERENLDEAVVGSMGPTFKRLLSEWSPLEQPQALTASLKRWRAILKVSERADGKEEDLWPTTKGGVKQGKKTTNVMTPFESLLWNSWMPKMRSCINNDWKVEEASSAVELVESWRGIIPRFIMDNILDQLILPKLKAAISDWDPRRSKASLHRIVFPWISVFGDERFNETLSEAKRRLKASLKTIKLDQVVAARLDLEEWKGVYRSEEWDNLMLETVVPRLGSKLRNEFKVDPSDQDMTIMTNVVSWWSSKLIRPSILSRLLEREFFPKWLNVLHQWLIQPRANLDEVAQWYTYWKSWFPSEMVEMEGIQHGFNKAIRLMDRALELGERRETQLEKPDTNPLPRRTAHPPGVSSKRDSRDQAEEDNEDDSSFRRIVEEEASRHDLIVISLNRSEPSSAKTLLTISDNVGGKRGIQFYIQDDVCWVQDSKPSNSNGSAPFSPLGVSDLIQRVKRMR
ncbi:TFP11-domain-containing protein [Violaceomyces palustris]|uniref:TFP11-domain-containing protein n=1 Tax=Violaceomyces palustris TaxID=1673888 RepID=A0ACD0NUD2_9BASI|nr:TFP11-domain-containing protein [Violaceomyces palustris]